MRVLKLDETLNLKLLLLTCPCPKVNARYMPVTLSVILPCASISGDQNYQLL